VLSNDFDPDGDPIYLTSVSGNIAPYATASFNWGDGSFTYQLNVDHPTIRSLGPGSSLNHVILYSISDGTSSATGTLTVWIRGIADPPV
jgi:VCBS repeat-containing protein